MLAAALVVAGVIAAVGPWFGVVHAADGASVSAFSVARWVAVAPGVLALILAGVRAELGLAATAGAGLVGAAHLLADVAVVTETDRVSRPELFVETTEQARPFGVAAGGWVLLAADAAMVVVGVLAARLLATRVSIGNGPPDDVLFGSTPPENREPTDGGGDAAAVVAMTPPTGRRRLDLPMVGTGLAGAVLLLVGSLDIPYTGGYLDLRLLPFGTSLSGLAAAVLLASIVSGIVLVAAGLPRDVAQAMLGGTGMAAAVPSLTAVVAVAAGAPTGLSGVVWWSLAGSAILAASGLLARRGPTHVRASIDAPSPRVPTLVASICALAAAASLAGASSTSLLYLDGAPPDEVAGGLLVPAALPLLVSAVPLALAGALTLLPATALAGRAALWVVWAGAGYALGRAFWATSLVTATSTGSTSGITHAWTIGPGGWLMGLGALLAIVAAVLAVVGHRRAAEASPEIVDDESLALSRGRRRWIALALSAAIPVVLALPVYGGLGVSSAPGLIHGVDLDTWAFWALAVGGWTGLWLGASTRYPQVAAAGPVAAAAVLVQPVMVPGAVRALPGFTLSAGFWAILVLSGVLVVVAVPFVRSSSGILTRPPWSGGGAPAGPAVNAESKGGKR